MFRTNLNGKTYSCKFTHNSATTTLRDFLNSSEGCHYLDYNTVEISIEEMYTAFADYEARQPKTLKETMCYITICDTPYLDGKVDTNIKINDISEYFTSGLATRSKKDQPCRSMGRLVSLGRATHDIDPEVRTHLHSAYRKWINESKHQSLAGAKLMLANSASQSLVNELVKIIDEAE